MSFGLMALMRTLERASSYLLSPQPPPVLRVHAEDRGFGYTYTGCAHVENGVGIWVPYHAPMHMHGVPEGGHHTRGTVR